MHHYKRLLRPVIDSALVLCLFGVATVADASTVENYVSVQANSGPNGISTVHSQTIVNGQVIEDVTKTGTGSVAYHSSSQTDGSTTVITSATASAAAATTEQRASLEALLAQLRHYVALLTQLMASTTLR